MSVGADGFVEVPVTASVNHVAHVVGLGAAFEVVGVDADTVVALVSDDWGPVEVGEVERDSVGCSVFSEYVDLSVAVASA